MGDRGRRLSEECSTPCSMCVHVCVDTVRVSCCAARMSAFLPFSLPLSLSVCLCVCDEADDVVTSLPMTTLSVNDMTLTFADCKTFRLHWR